MDTCCSCGQSFHWIEMVRTQIGAVCQDCGEAIVTAWILNSRGSEPPAPLAKLPIVNGKPPLLIESRPADVHKRH